MAHMRRVSDCCECRRDNRIFTHRMVAQESERGRDGDMMDQLYYKHTYISILYTYAVALRMPCTMRQPEKLLFCHVLLLASHYHGYISPSIWRWRCYSLPFLRAKLSTNVILMESRRVSCDLKASVLPLHKINIHPCTRHRYHRAHDWILFMFMERGRTFKKQLIRDWF